MDAYRVTGPGSLLQICKNDDVALCGNGILGKETFYNDFTKGVSNVLEYFNSKSNNLELLLNGDLSDKSLEIDLEYFDSLGNPVSSKEAYKILSRCFHGRGLAKNKKLLQVHSAQKSNAKKNKSTQRKNSEGKIYGLL